MLAASLLLRSCNIAQISTANLECLVRCNAHQVSLLLAAVRSSSAGSDPATEKLECCLDHRSLLGMLQQRSLSSNSATTQPGSRPPLTPRQVAVSDPDLLRSRLGREAFLLNYKVGLLRLLCCACHPLNDVCYDPCACLYAPKQSRATDAVVQFYQ